MEHGGNKMNYMYTICSIKEIKKIRKLLLKIIGISFVNQYKKPTNNKKEIL